MDELKKIKIIDSKNYQEIVEKFSCKVKEIDDYLKKKAYIDMSKIKSATYLLFKNNELFGFYTLNIYQIEDNVKVSYPLKQGLKLEVHSIVPVNAPC